MATPTTTNHLEHPVADAPTGSPLDSLLDEPTFEECHAEFNRYHEANLAGQLDPGNAHANQFVAFYDGRVVGYGPDGFVLRNERAAALGVHPARLIVEHLLVLEVFGAVA